MPPMPDTPGQSPAVAPESISPKKFDPEKSADSRRPTHPIHSKALHSQHPKINDTRVGFILRQSIQTLQFRHPLNPLMPNPFSQFNACGPSFTFRDDAAATNMHGSHSIRPGPRARLLFRPKPRRNPPPHPGSNLNAERTGQTRQINREYFICRPPSSNPTGGKTSMQNCGERKNCTWCNRSARSPVVLMPGHIDISCPPPPKVVGRHSHRIEQPRDPGSSAISKPGQ